MHYYKILKHKAGFDEATNDWEKMFAHYIADTDKHVIFGALPLTFDSDGGAIHWTIYGNNTQHNYSTEGTLPLTFSTRTAGAASDWEIEGNNDVGKNYANVETGATEAGVTFTFDPVAGTVTANGTATRDAQYRVYFNYPGQPNNSTVPPGNYYFSGCPSGGSSSKYDCYSWDYDMGERSKKWDGTTNVDSDFGLGNCQVKINGHKQSITMRIKSGYTANNVVFKPMLRAADTSAEFEPYQIGVGQRTKNSFEITEQSKTVFGVVMTLDADAGTATFDGKCTASNYKIYIIGYVTYDVDNYLLLSGGVDGGSSSSYYLYAYDTTAGARPKKWDGTSTSESVWDSQTSQEILCPAGHNIRIAVVIRENIEVDNIIFRPMLRAADTSAEFIPFGYEIPLNVNTTTQDIYIGSTPLTEGQSISKTSTGVDIAAVEGSNTITTDLYNKPSMSIVGVDYVGVGERTKNKFNKNACELVQIDIEGTMKFGTQLDVKGGTQYTLINTNPRNVDIYILVHKEDSDVYQSTLVDRSPVGFTIPSIEYGIFKAYLRTNDDILTDWDTVGVTNIALYEGFVTNPTFVPFGYQIPLTITSGQQSTDYDIFIGDAPLTEGQSVSDTVEITAYEGINTLDTTLANKPNAEITYEL